VLRLTSQVEWPASPFTISSVLLDETEHLDSSSTIGSLDHPKISDSTPLRSLASLIPTTKFKKKMSGHLEKLRVNRAQVKSAELRTSSDNFASCRERCLTDSNIGRRIYSNFVKATTLQIVSTLTL
jgi:hypothetical protein